MRVDRQKAEATEAILRHDGLAREYLSVSRLVNTFPKGILTMAQQQHLRVGLVGCGQIADAHLQQIKLLPNAAVVGVCDLEPLLARQAAERFNVPGQFSSVSDLIHHARPDVVHITTPVQSHASLAIELLSAGVHVYVEKPFTLNITDARRVIQVAMAQRRLVCLGHDQLFDPIWLDARRIVDSGAIGEVQHVDSILSYPIDGPFGAAVVRDPAHWVRRLPGGLFHNTMSHPLYRITEFLDDPCPALWANWFSKLPSVPFPTELRVQLRGAKTTGSLLFMSTAKPLHRLTRLYGSKGSFEVDLNSQLIRMDRSAKLPGALGRLETPLVECQEVVRNVARNVRRFWRGDFNYFTGMRELFARFYDSISNGSPLPVPYSEVLRVTELMDRIFEDCRAHAVRRELDVDRELRTEHDTMRLLDRATELLESADEPLSERPVAPQAAERRGVEREPTAYR